MFRQFKGSFAVHVRYFNSEPKNISYYKLAVHDLDIVYGPKRVESSKVEAAMRQIAQKLFFSDGAQQSLLEQEINDDEKMFLRSQQLKYLRDFVDARDLAPRPLPTSQTKLSKNLRHVLQQNRPSLVNEVAELLWKHPITRRSTFQMVSRELLKLGHGNISQDIMKSLLLFTRKQGDGSYQKLLDNSVYTLCLEVAMANDDHDWFMELGKASQTKVSNQKFRLVEGDPAVELKLAEGYMKFGHPHLLDKVLERNNTKPFFVKLLAVSMEMAARQKDEARAVWTFSEFEKRFDPTREATVRFLLLARKVPATKPKVAQYVARLSPQKCKLFKLKQPVWQYIHPYAN